MLLGNSSWYTEIEVRMDTFKLTQHIPKKSILHLSATCTYLMLILFLKWHLKPVQAGLWFLGGGFIGMYFVDIAEAIFRIHPSPFRSIVFEALLAITSFFIVTSSSNAFAGGLVLSIFLTLILWQTGEWSVSRNIASWYRMVSGSATTSVQWWGIVIAAIIFFVNTALFIRS